jgi:hypothetical protein
VRSVSKDDLIEIPRFLGVEISWGGEGTRLDWGMEGYSVGFHVSGRWDA